MNQKQVKKITESNSVWAIAARIIGDEAEVSDCIRRGQGSHVCGGSCITELWGQSLGNWFRSHYGSMEWDENGRKAAAERVQSTFGVGPEADSLFKKTTAAYSWATRAVWVVDGDFVAHLAKGPGEVFGPQNGPFRFSAPSFENGGGEILLRPVAGGFTVDSDGEAWEGWDEESQTWLSEYD